MEEYKSTIELGLNGSLVSARLTVHGFKDCGSLLIIGSVCAVMFIQIVNLSESKVATESFAVV